MIRNPPTSDGASSPRPGDPLGAYPRALVESALDQVLASAVFRRSERHRRFMRHVVQAALDGRGDRLKEVVLGIELFDRKLAAYDPRQDPIVRVEAGRVREKLARYYATDGAGDPFMFVVPVGSYVPQFVRRTGEATPERPVESFAVLPFATGAGCDADAAFAIGLADQLINRLGRMRDLKVVARVSAFQARERNLDVRDIGKLLQVTRVFDGSIQRQGQRMRCIAHLYRARDGIVLWSQSFDSDAMGQPRGEEIDLFAFQDHIVEILMAAASPQAPEPPPGRPTTDRVAGVVADRRKARDLLERASYLSRRYDAANATGVIELFEQAVALEPANLQAHLALATAYINQIALLNAPSSALLPKVRAAVAKVLEIDPADCEAISLQASIAFRFDYDWKRAQGLFQKALRIAPHAIGVNYRYASGLVFDGQFALAFRHLDVANALDPLNLGLRASSVHMLAYAREYDRAEREGAAILELEPAHLYIQIVLGLLHLYRHDPGSALRRFDTVVAALPDHPAAYFTRACALGLSGDVARGAAELEALVARLAGHHCPPYYLAMAHAGLGDRDAVLAALERAAVERDVLFSSLPVDPLFERYHDDAGFIALLARHGLRPPLA